MKSLGQILSGEMQEGECPTHGHFRNLRIPPNALHCPKCVQAEIAQKTVDAHAESQAQRRLGALKTTVYRSGIPPRFMSKTFEDYQPADEKQSRVLRICQAYADRFDERHKAGGGLVMCGKPGTGKTHLASAIGNQLMQAGRSVLFATVMTAVGRVKETYDRGRESKETTRQVIARFYEPDLLILDEVGVQFNSEYERLVLFEIINGRYERVLPTILLSNLTEQELDKPLGERTMDRMKEGGGVVLAFDWESRRHAIKSASKELPAWVSA